MTTEDWFDALTAELLQQSPFRRSEYFRRFASGALSRADVWGHISQHSLLIAAFPRIFSGIHTRCEDFEVRKDCARHLLVEDLGYFDGRVAARRTTTSSFAGSATTSATRARRTS